MCTIIPHIYIYTISLSIALNHSLSLQSLGVGTVVGAGIIVSIIVNLNPDLPDYAPCTTVLQGSDPLIKLLNICF